MFTEGIHREGEGFDRKATQRREGVDLTLVELRWLNLGKVSMKSPQISMKSLEIRLVDVSGMYIEKFWGFDCGRVNSEKYWSLLFTGVYLE